jgi:hypothetical protein
MSCALSSWYGTSNVNISHITTPMDQTSHFSHTCARHIMFDTQGDVGKSHGTPSVPARQAQCNGMSGRQWEFSNKR